ncbi:MAG: tryptophan synthase subunit alpha [Candidatus Cloacimonadota bacterium]|nr:MAG: tryptophan synthase subunit alpha [Candidatus Cloacimonadota bacterium]
MNRIQKLFQKKSKKIVPFITAGFPTKDATKNMVLAFEESGASMIELGMPYSDPLADGVVIQKASDIALSNGVNLSWIINTVKEIRLESQIPIILMGYINPILSYGLDKFVKDCSEAGVDGFILPDLPPEEASEYVTLCEQYNLSSIFLVAPNTSNERIKEVSTLAKDLIYCVSILGITGGSVSTDNKIPDYLKRVQENSICPYVVGFGIDCKEKVDWMNDHSDGAVIGSHFLKNLMECETSDDAVRKVKELMKELY